MGALEEGNVRGDVGPAAFVLGVVAGVFELGDARARLPDLALDGLGRHAGGKKGPVGPFEEIAPGLVARQVVAPAGTVLLPAHAFRSSGGRRRVGRHQQSDGQQGNQTSRAHGGLLAGCGETQHFTLTAARREHTRSVCNVRRGRFFVDLCVQLGLGRISW